MAVRIGWRQALAWRMRRQLLDPVGTESVEDVVRRLGGVQAQVGSTAELAIRVRRASSRPGEVGRALYEGRLIKTWAMRGALHLLTPEDGGAFLSVIAAARPWERAGWQRYFGLTSELHDLLRDTVREALGNGVLTRDELAQAVAGRRGLERLGEELRSGWGTLLKPLAWQGELCFGPSRGTRVTFTRPETASPGWAGLPDPDEAARRVIASYFGAYGPASTEAFENWLAGGWFGRRRLRMWMQAFGDGLVEIDIEGERAHLLAEDVDELASTKPTKAVRLVPGFDQYVLGPGTADARVVPPARRAAVSKQSGWISPVVLVGGVVGGTWDLQDDELRVAWFAETGPVPRRRLAAEVARLSSILERDLRLEVRDT